MRLHIFWLLLFLGFIHAFPCCAQTKFKNIYYNGASGTLYELSSLSFMYCMGNGFARTDQSGTINFEKTYVPVTLNVLNILRQNDNEFYLTGLVFDTTCSPIYPFGQHAITKSDSMGVIEWGKFYRFNNTCGSDTYYSSITSLNSVLLGGVVGGPTTGPFSSIIMVDSTGHLLWSKYFYNHQGGAQFAAELTDKSVITGLNIDSGGAVLARLDSAGNQLWSKSFVRPRGFLHSILPEADGTFLVTGTTDSLRINPGDQYPLWFHPTLFLMKLDTSGQVLWAKEYDDSTNFYDYFTLDPSKIIRLNDGSYMIYCGKYGSPGQHIVMMHIDINGNLIWNRGHGPSGFLNQCQYIIQTSDGGFLMSEGTIGNYPNGWQGAYELIKTDSLGHSTGCFEYTENINVYPYFPVDSDVVLLSIDGATEYTANVRDTTYGPTAVYDECVLLTAGNTIAMDKTLETIVYPSPTNGKFAVRSQQHQPNREERYLTVYDSMGRIVLQKQIIGKEDTPVDLSSHSKGIYLVRITTGDHVSESKVVVE